MLNNIFFLAQKKKKKKILILKRRGKSRLVQLFEIWVKQIYCYAIHGGSVLGYAKVTSS